MIHKAMFALRFIVALFVVLFFRLTGVELQKPQPIRKQRVRTTRRSDAEYGVSLTKVRAWYTVSTTSSLGIYFNSILEDSMFVAREVNLMPNLVTRYVGKGLAARKSPIYPQLAATIVAEGSDYSAAVDWNKSAKMVLTPQIAKVQNIITQSMIDTDPDMTARDLAIEQGGAVATKIDADLCALFTSFTTDKGSAGQAVTVAKTGAAISVLRNNKARGQIYAVWHPYGWHDLWTQLGQPAANQAFLGEVANEALRQFYVGQMLAAQHYIDSNIATSGTDAVSAVFNKESLALDVRQEASQAVEEDASIAGFGYEVNVEAWYAVGVRRAEFGVKITHDVTEPT